LLTTLASGIRDAIHTHRAIGDCSYLGGWFTWISAVKNARYPEGESALQAIRALFDQSALDLHWYSPEMQFASLVIPRFVDEPVRGKNR
jgi:hypothetical protein